MKKANKNQILDKYKDVFFKDGKCDTIGRRLIRTIIPFLNYLTE
jgi:hypothetical protein